MIHLHYEHYFDIASYRHASLFLGSSKVWEALSQLHAYLLKQELGKIQTEIPQGAFLVNPESIHIGKGSIVEPGAYIKGPCWIGENCVIRHGAYIRGDFLCGNDCVIGHDTEVKNTIFLDNVHAAHFAYLGDAILGNRVNLGAGTKCANLKLNNSPVVLYIDGERIPTGLRKFGAVIGDGGQLGCNSVTNPGTLLSKNVSVHPLVNVGGYIPPEHQVKNGAQLVVSHR